MSQCHTFQLKTTPTSQCRQQSDTGVHSLSAAGLIQDTPVSRDDSSHRVLLLRSTPTVGPLCPVLYSGLHRFVSVATSRLYAFHLYNCMLNKLSDLEK